MIYVTSDLHGIDPEQFFALLRRANFTDADFLFVLGDVIDRGEHGITLLRWLAEQPNAQLILGNHEAMMLSCTFLFDPVTEENLEQLDVTKMQLMERWMRNGAAPTLAQVRKLLKEEPDVLEGLLDLLRDAPLYEVLKVRGKKYVLVHGGLPDFHPEKPLEDYDPGRLLWERPTLETRYYEDATVVIGHTPTQFLQPESAGKALRTDSWICIDTGAAMGGSPMLLRLDDEAMFY